MVLLILNRISNLFYFLLTIIQEFPESRWYNTEGKSGLWSSIQKFLLDFCPAVKQIIANLKNYNLDFSKFQLILTWLCLVLSKEMETHVLSFENTTNTLLALSRSNFGGRRLMICRIYNKMHVFFTSPFLVRKGHWIYTSAIVHEIRLLH